MHQQILIINAKKCEHPNSYKRWSIYEEARLREELKRGYTMAEISKLHGKTSSAVSARIKQIRL
jgi:hypothetical protein